MKKLVVVCFLLLCGTLFAQEFNVEHDYNTGDKELDHSLEKINVEANADRKNFIQSLSLSYKIPGAQIEFMMQKNKMSPADIYFALLLSDVTKKPVEKVVEQFDENSGQGWGVIAKNMGIKPGSSEFHEMKRKMRNLKKGKKGNDSDDEDDGEPKGRGQGRGRGKGR